MQRSRIDITLERTSINSMFKKGWFLKYEIDLKTHEEVNESEVQNLYPHIQNVDFNKDTNNSVEEV